MAGQRDEDHLKGMSACAAWGQRMTREPGKRRLDFGNLPLVEAAVRASLIMPVQLTYAVVNAVGARLQAGFPIVTEPQQFEMAPGIGLSPSEFGPSQLPGAVYAGHKSGLSVGVFPQLVVARWVKQYVPSETQYPRYSSLRDALWTGVDAYRRCVGDGFPIISVVNMSYVNFLSQSDPESVRAYLSDRAELRAMSEARKIRKLEAAWSKTEDLDVRFALEQVTAKLGGGIKDGYRLTTAAGIRLAESLDAKSALERVHETLQDFFLELISEYARNEWQLKEPESD